MHKLDALCDQSTDDSDVRGNLPYLTYLSKKVDEFTKCLDLGFIERAQEREHHQLLRVRALKFDNLQERRTMIVWHRRQLR